MYLIRLVKKIVLEEFYCHKNADGLKFHRILNFLWSSTFLKRKIDLRVIIYLFNYSPTDDLKISKPTKLQASVERRGNYSVAQNKQKNPLCLSCQLGSIDHEAMAEHQTWVLLELTTHPGLTVVCCPQVGRN